MVILLIFTLLIPGAAAFSQASSDSPALNEVNGEELEQLINSYEGEKAVLVNMWATWCGPCVEEFPHIVKLQRKYKDELQVIFVSADFDKETARGFLKEQGVDWTTYFKTGNDQDFINTISDKWTGAMPFTKIISKKGNLVASWENKADFETFESNIKQALNP
ncbi:MAG: TlpA disulfide reductase family protein [Balneolaceae bacterium]|nr:TlpA disulfide reductase family protein [Balneolaceae bacterium]